ncbi:MAG: FlgD immunoglobulin-like domain containing protein [Candidatus Latescibacterota bacterium]
MNGRESLVVAGVVLALAASAARAQPGFPFSDDAESAAASQALWTSQPDTAWSIASAAAHSGNQVWSLRPGTDAYLTLSGPIDLSAVGVTNPTLSLWVLGSHPEQRIGVEVSANGGATWESRLGWQGIASFGAHTQWTELQVSLADFRSTQVVVRIQGIEQFGDPYYLWLDDISIDNPPSAIGTGDVDGNGSIQLGDAVLILRHLARFITLAGNGAAAADVSGNGTISPYDAVLILQYVAGIITRFPAAGKPVSSDAVLAWAQPHVDGETGVATVPLRLEGSGRVNAVQLTVPVDPGQVVVEDLVARVPGDWQVLHRVDGNALRLVMAGLTPVGPGELAELRVRLLQPGSQLRLEGEAVLDESAPQRLLSAGLGARPTRFELQQNSPNPFNPTTQIRYTLPEAGHVRLAVYDLLGHEVRRLTDGVQAGGAHQVEWDGLDEAGRQVGAGVFLYRLESAEQAESRKMVLVQ